MLQGWRNSLEVREICREYRLLTMTHQEFWYENIVLDPDHVMFKILNKSDDPIGVCGITFIDWRSRHGLLSMYLAPSITNCNSRRWVEYYPAILTELKRIAFDDLNLHCLRAEIYDFDPRKDIILSNGFVETGKRRQQYYHKGKFWDIIIADVLK